MKKGVKLVDIIQYLCIIVFISGIFYLIYTNFEFNTDNKKVINEFNNRDKAEINKDLNKMKEKNRKNKSNTFYTQDPFETKVEYKDAEHVKDIGVLVIPKISVKLAIYDKTNTYTLGKGIGLLEGTHYPTGGIGNTTVLTGHRGTDRASLLKNAGKLEVGDTFYIDNGKEDLYYKIYKKKIVLPQDTNEVKMIPNKDTVIIITCDTPDITKGLNTHRLILTAERIGKPEKLQSSEVDDSVVYKILGGLLAVILISLFIKMLLLIFRKKKKKGEEN